jgi:hypothetical protein
VAVLTVSSDPDASIVLIGPSASGKSSVGRILAESLGWACVDLDDLRPTYYPEFGIDPDAERLALEQRGLQGILSYWKPFELRSVERVMREHPLRKVIAFGGGQSDYRDEADIEWAATFLSLASHVILLLPDASPERAVDILLERISRDPDVPADVEIESFLNDFRPIVEAQVRSVSNRRLATDVLITGEDEPDEIAGRVYALVRRPDHAPLRNDVARDTP